MSDEETKAVTDTTSSEVVVDSPSTEEQQAPQENDVQRTEPQDADSNVEEKEENQQATDSSNESQQQQNKPTRAERRIKQLLSKLKENQTEEPKSNSDLLNGKQLPKQEDNSLIKPEELETGIDPNALEERVAGRIQNANQALKEQIKLELAYEQTKKDHLSDIESVSRSKEIQESPILEKLVAEKYDLLNNTVDPYSGQKIFTPTVKMSEVMNMVKQDLDKLTSKAVAETNNKVADQVGQSAIMGSNSKENTTTLSQEEINKMLVENPGKLRRMLEKKLPVADY